MSRRESDALPNYRHFSRKYRTTSILRNVSNSTSPAATEILAYFIREYYSRAWQNIDKPLLRFALTSYGEGKFPRETLPICGIERPSFHDRKENISLFCQSVLASRIHAARNLIVCVLQQSDE